MTIGTFIINFILKYINKFFGLIAKYHTGIIWGFLGIIVYSLYFGYCHPVDFSGLSNYNFVRPGEDMNWELRMFFTGVISASVWFIFHYWYVTIGAMIVGALTQIVLTRKIN